MASLSCPMESFDAFAFLFTFIFCVWLLVSHSFTIRYNAAESCPDSIRPITRWYLSTSRLLVVQIKGLLASQRPNDIPFLADAHTRLSSVNPPQIPSNIPPFLRLPKKEFTSFNLPVCLYGRITQKKVYPLPVTR